MAMKYDTVEEFRGYTTKPDVTNTDKRFLTDGSFNVLVNDGEKLQGRNGYEVVGQSSKDRYAIESAFTWKTSSGDEIPLRGTNNSLQFLYDSTWTTLVDSLPTARFGFPESSESGWWDNSEGIDILPFVAKDSNIYSWSGCIAVVSAVTSNTITIDSHTTWAEARLVGSTGTVIVDGDEYAYTGVSGAQLTGVTPDPSAAGVGDGDVIFQKITTNSNKPGSGLTNDIIDIIQNQVVVGDNSSREIYFSTNTDFTDYSTISTPREPGESTILTLDNTPVAFAVQENTLYVSAGKSDWYEVIFDLQSISTTFIENISVKKLKNAPLQAAKEKDLVAHIKNSVVFISGEPTLDTLGRVENINTPQSMPLSDPIKPSFDSYDFTGGDIIYYKNQIFIAVPQESLVLIYDLNNGWWQPPQKMPIAKFSIVEGKLYGHSKEVQETYELFKKDVYADAGNIIDMQAVFAYRNFGDRHQKKQFDEYMIEGYISPQTNLTLTLEYEYEGSQGEKEFTITGNDEAILFGKGAEGGLGSLPLGSATLGSSKETPSDLKKFRQVNGTRPLDFFEMRAIFSTSSDDAQFEIISHGPQVSYSPIQNNSITK